MGRHNEKPFYTLARFIHEWHDILLAGSLLSSGLGGVAVGLGSQGLGFTLIFIALLSAWTMTAMNHTVLEITFRGLHNAGLPSVLDRADDDTGTNQEGDQRGT